MTRTCWNPVDDRRAVEMRHQGATDGAIAAAIGRSAHAVQTRLSRLRVHGASMPSQMTGPWTEERNVAVIRMLDNGETYASIARALGISRECVRINVRLLRAEGRVEDPDDDDDFVLVPEGDPLLAALHREYPGRSA